MRLGPDGRPVAVVYRIAERDVPQIQARMRDAINTVRQQQGLAPVEFDVALTSAAATQARDMALQGRPWHFGSDGSSPIDRVRRVGYTGHFLGETLSETYETELETLTAWLTEADTRGILLDPRARQLGFAWHQDANGKLWWVLTTGVDDGSGLAAQQGQGQAPIAMTAPNRA
ncbi:CAP domain-containing protein [Pararhodobacter zhoushanensis]|uniref:CAP domain-containing protein n=2 Tax=Pararhodobacter zhoushanensis TaxID=2479545 RepID=A0ABT3GUK9_9RHOB|nr:CAP domain-containing protein [Pararhodobacter zhoushanensis]